MRSFDVVFRNLVALALSLAAISSGASDGDLDSAFGADGVARTGLTNTQAYAMAVRPDGRVIVCGAYSDQVSWMDEFFIAQYLPDGSLDPAFGSGGVAHIDFGTGKDACTSLALLPMEESSLRDTATCRNSPRTTITSPSWRDCSRTAHSIPVSAMMA